MRDVNVDVDVPGVSWSHEHEAYTTRFDEDGSPSLAAVRTLEAVLDDWSTPLFDYVDPDALDALAKSSDTITITFEVEGAAVTVHGDGRVFVSP